MVEFVQVTSQYEIKSCYIPYSYGTNNCSTPYSVTTDDIRNIGDQSGGHIYHSIPFCDRVKNERKWSFSLNSINIRNTIEATIEAAFISLPLQENHFNTNTCNFDRRYIGTDRSTIYYITRSDTTD